MLVDGHVHIFEDLGGACGFESADEHLQHARDLMFHRSVGRRLDDNALVTGREWHRGEDPKSLNFRGGDYGKFLWTVDGADYARYYLPPTARNLDSPPEQIIAQLDYAGIDRALVQAGHTYGRQNDYLSGVIARYPDRLWALATVEEWRADNPSQAAELDRAITKLGLRGLFFNTASIALNGRSEMLDDPVFDPFWNRVRELGIPVFWNITSSDPGPDGWMKVHEAFGRWVERYPEVPSIYTHGIPLYRFMRDGHITIPDEIWKPLEAPNVFSEVLIPILMGGVWDFPYVEAQGLIREYYERLGPSKLIWGSDMPNVERHCTYMQCLDYLRKYCDFISASDMDAICGGNLAALFEA